MKLMMIGAFAVLALVPSAPARALTPAQENCVGLGMPESLQSQLVDEMLTNDSGAQVTEKVMALAKECAVKTNVAPAKHDAYINFAVANAIVLDAGERLDKTGYPVTTLNSAIDAMVLLSSDGEVVYFSKEGLTDAGIDFLFSYFDDRGMNFEPKGEADLVLLSTYLAAAGKIVSVYSQLFGG
ncbi:MAG: hypothetical protein EDM03_01805 [Porphyrobacter sp. IPPAS B-1204]|nr:MAG: hypothetical protein EDM03_01805 [Porphyrobacter sp. IPPAS B-1204]